MALELVSIEFVLIDRKKGSNKLETESEHRKRTSAAERTKNKKKKRKRKRRERLSGALSRC